MVKGFFPYFLSFLIHILIVFITIYSPKFSLNVKKELNNPEIIFVQDAGTKEIKEYHLQIAYSKQKEVIKDFEPSFNEGSENTKSTPIIVKSVLSDKTQDFSLEMHDNINLVSEKSEGASNNQENKGLVVNPAPIYPVMARKKGWEGTVLLSVHISKHGIPQEVSIKKSSGHTLLDAAAVETVQQWHFNRSNGIDMNKSSWIEIPIEFKLVNSQ